MTSGPVAAFAARPGARQFAKFCVVGASSAIIDFGLSFLFAYVLHLAPAIAFTLSFLIAVCNGFYWNRRWTFRADDGDIRTQYPKFLATNAVGLCLNLLIITLVLILAEAAGWMHTQRSPSEIVALLTSGQGSKAFHPLAFFGAKIVATAVVMVWNFTAAKFFAFKR